MGSYFFKIDRRDHAYLTCIAEAHEGLCTISTVDQQQGIVRISTPQGRKQEVDQFIEAFQHEIDMQEVAYPGC